MTEESDFDAVLLDLQVPSEFSRYENITEASILSRLELWKSKALEKLNDLKQILAKYHQMPLDRHAKTIANVATFTGDDEWIEPTMRDASIDVLSLLPSTTTQVIEVVLKQHVKPLFLATPHPAVNLETGRKLPRPAGGSLASYDHFDDQVWKSHPGTANIVAWCIRSLESADYERLWPLVIPPVMTLLDDYQARYKLKGISIVSDMLDSAPSNLLRRTGIGELFMTSLTTGLNHMHDDLSPDLIRNTVPVLLKLIDLITEPDTEVRFDKQCHILGDKIIGGVWVYAAQNKEIVEASMDVLPALVRALGIGSVRFLKALIPQCSHILTPNPFAKKPISMQLSSLRALGTIIEVCRPRMAKWRGSIIEAVGKCGVSSVDSDTLNDDLKNAISDVFQKLAEACPSVTKNEYPLLMATDSKIFSRLIPQRN